MALKELADELDKLVVFLEWKRDTDGFRRQLITNYYEVSLDNFDAFIEKAIMDSIPRARDLAEIINSMPREKKLEFSRLPYVVETIFYSEGKLFHSGVAFLIFLAMGFVLDSDRGLNNYTSSVIEGAPVAVDCPSIPFPLNFTGIIRWSEENTEYSSEVAKAVFQKIEKSTTLLKMNQRVFEFVTDFTSLLSIRQSVGNQNSISSGSFRGVIGLTSLTNPHLEIADPFFLSESLVHEAIHSAIYMMEYTVGVSIAGIADTRKIIKSPWTGASISVDNLFQAVFVWYGLYHFWRNMQELGVDESVSQSNIERAFGGFEKLSDFLVHSGLYNRDVICEMLPKMALAVIKDRSSMKVAI